jgi:predicted RNase H-like HicB family nuclease
MLRFYPVRKKALSFGGKKHTAGGFKKKPPELSNGVRRRYSKMKFRVILEPSEEGGYTVIVPSLPGCVSEGNTREEALKNIREAIELYLEPVEDDLSFSPDSEQLEITL